MSFKGFDIFKDLTDEEEHEFRAYAQKNDPPDMKKWEVYHPICRQEWERRGIRPEQPEKQSLIIPTTSPAGIEWTYADSVGEWGEDEVLNRTTRVFIVGFRTPEEPMYFIDEVLPAGSDLRHIDTPIQAESYQYGIGNDTDIVLGQATTTQEAMAAIDKHASFKFFGSVSHGTMRSEDLIPAFERIITELTGEDVADKYNRDDEGDPEEYLETLFSRLEQLAPTGYYFGSHPGDGSDCGFWPSEDNA